jgi:TRAP-type mannitol/chloroaromatic compound transport system permease small subunit
MDFSGGQLVQGGMLLALGGIARILYNTTVLTARLDEKLDAHEKRVDRIEERVDDLAS